MQRKRVTLHDQYRERELLCKINTCRERELLSKNILIKFKAEKFPFILSTNVFKEFLSDLESTVGNKLNLRAFNFFYRYPVLTLPSTHK